MTTTTGSQGTIEHIDPNAIILEANVRPSAPLTQETAAFPTCAATRMGSTLSAIAFRARIPTMVACSGHDPRPPRRCRRGSCA